MRRVGCFSELRTTHTTNHGRLTVLTGGWRALVQVAVPPARRVRPRTVAGRVLDSHLSAHGANIAHAPARTRPYGSALSQTDMFSRHPAAPPTRCNAPGRSLPADGVDVAPAPGRLPKPAWSRQVDSFRSSWIIHPASSRQVDNGRIYLRQVAFRDPSEEHHARASSACDRGWPTDPPPPADARTALTV